MKLLHFILGVAFCATLSSCGRSYPPLSEEQPKYETNAVVKALRHNEIDVYYNTPYCQENEILGAYDRRHEYVEICIDTHAGYDSKEIYDTIRHEAVHAMQDCIGGTVYSEAQIREWATKEDLEFVMDEYERRDHTIELEAVVMARKYSDEQIAKMLYNFCINN